MSSAASAPALRPTPPPADALVQGRRLAASWAKIGPLVIAGVVFGVSSWAMQSYPVGIFHDDGVYLILAKAIAGGEGYRYLHIPGAPLATHFPPGYPLLLAALWKLAPSFPQNVVLFLFANAVLLAVAARNVNDFARRLGWPAPLSAAAAIAGTLSLPLLMLASLVLSEVLFLTLLLPLLVAAERLVRDDPGWKRAAVIGLAAGALALVRTHAVAAIAGVVIVLLARRRWRAAACVAAGACVALLPWQLWVTLHERSIPAPLSGSYGSYLGWFFDGVAGGGSTFVLRTAATNLAHVTALFADRVAPWTPAWARITSVAVAGCLVAAGIIRQRHRLPVTIAFFVCYVGVVLVWPFTPWRFLWAIWPIPVVLMLEGARACVSGRLPLTRGALPLRIALVSAAALVGIGAVGAEVKAYRTRAWTEPARNASREIAPLMRWVAQRTRPGDVLLADGESMVYLFTGRQAMPPVPFTAAEYVVPRTLDADARSLEELLSRYPVRYLLTVVPSTRVTAANLAARDQNGAPRLHEIDELVGGAVFEVERR